MINDLINTYGDPAVYLIMFAGVVITMPIALWIWNWLEVRADPCIGGKRHKWVDHYFDRGEFTRYTGRLMWSSDSRYRHCEVCRKKETY